MGASRSNPEYLQEHIRQLIRGKTVRINTADFPKNLLLNQLMLFQYHVKQQQFFRFIKEIKCPFGYLNTPLQSHPPSYAGLHIERGIFQPPPSAFL